jgi:hypothetical protein
MPEMVESVMGKGPPSARTSQASFGAKPECAMGVARPRERSFFPYCALYHEQLFVGKKAIF